MSLLDLFLDKQKWQDFLNEKIQKAHLSKREQDFFIEYINSEKYLNICKNIINNNYTFSIPKKILLNKLGSNKKRIVYSFNEDENIILKFLYYLLRKYDNIFCSNCYAFRQNTTVQKAFFNLLKNNNIDNMFAYKIDISNYFNSINIDLLLPMLKKVFVDDDKLFNFVKNILTADKSFDGNNIFFEKRGAMAGTPLSTFLANIYLSDLDKYFEDNNIIYARYSDDIIVFAEDINKLEEHKTHIYQTLNSKSLKINSDKECLFAKGEPWNFLGFEYCNKQIDLSKITTKKIKDKIRRKARALFRWKTRKQKSAEHAIKVMLRIFNNKFFKETDLKDLTWSKWYFPIITTAKSLKEIDNYFVNYLRYLSTGKFTKKNFNITYQLLKNWGYKSLVNEYYKHIKAFKN